MSIITYCEGSAGKSLRRALRRSFTRKLLCIINYYLSGTLSTVHLSPSLWSLNEMGIVQGNEIAFSTFQSSFLKLSKPDWFHFETIFIDNWSLNHSYRSELYVPQPEFSLLLLYIYNLVASYSTLLWVPSNAIRICDEISRQIYRMNWSINRLFVITVTEESIDHNNQLIKDNWINRLGRRLRDKFLCKL